MASSGGWWFGWRGVVLLAVLVTLMMFAATGCGGGNASTEDGGMPNTMVGDAGSGGGGGGGGGATTGDAGALPATLTVDAVSNSIVLELCIGMTPATISDMTPGLHTIGITASDLSKGSVSGTNNSQLPSSDDYVIVHVESGSATSRRFFMLNGVGTIADFTIGSAGAVQIMFIDSDTAFNGGRSTVTVDGTGPNTTVDGMANVLAWSTGCSATPATLTVDGRGHRATLADSTLTAGDGSRDDFVLLRLPSETPMDPARYVILNGVGTSIDFTPYLSQTLSAWFISSAPGASGRATVVVTDL